MSICHILYILAKGTQETLFVMITRTAYILVILSYIGLLVHSSFYNSPTFNEVGHLPAGLAHWQFQLFDLYRVNPPLPRMICALPVLLANPQVNWQGYDPSSQSEGCIPLALRFADANGGRVFMLYSIGRLGSIPFCLLEVWGCFRWAREIWGNDQVRRPRYCGVSSH